MFKIQKYEGLVAAPFTPMDKEGNLNPDLIGSYYSLLEKNKVSGAFINGSTGEGVSMTQKEKQINASYWSKCLNDNGKVRVINLVGGTSYQECIENAIHSSELGLSAIAVVAPYYFKPNVSALADFVAKIGEAVPSMPVYYYHIPVLTGVNVSIASFLPLVSKALPNFAGIKFTHEDFMDFLTCVNYEGGRYDLLWGRDECLLAALATGARGGVGSTYNYAAPLYNELISLYNDGRIEESRDLQQVSIRIVELLGKYGGISVGKAFMKYIGLDCGKFRLPIINMSDDTYKAFSDDVKALNIDKYFSKM